VLTGRPMPGHTVEAAAAGLAKLARIPEDRALQLLAGRETTVQRNLDREKAAAYVQAMMRAGVQARVAVVAAPEVVAAPAPAPAVAPVLAETVTCPGCGMAQPKRTLCRQCGVDMPRVLASRVEAARAPAQAVVVPSQSWSPSGRLDVLDVPLYRRSRLFEIGLFLFGTMLWGFFTMTDSTRGLGMRVFGGAMFLVFGAGMIFKLRDMISGPDLEEAAVHAALDHGIEISKKVSDYAIANQRLPGRSDPLGLPERPADVKEVVVGPAGRVRVTLNDNLKNSGGGSIIMTPVIVDQTIDWKCVTENVPTDYLPPDCGLRTRR
jgi:hypothetical protein